MSVKKIFVIAVVVLVAVICLSSCDENMKTEEPKNEYQIDYQWSVPDSNREKMAKFITETVRASNLHLTAGDYEDPEDVVEEVEEVAYNLFRTKEIGLGIKKPEDQIYYYHSVEELTKEELKIFNDLRNK